MCNVFVIVSKGTEGDPELICVEGVYASRESAENDLRIYEGERFDGESYWIQKTVFVLS